MTQITPRQKLAAIAGMGGGVGKCAGRIRREDRSLGVGVAGVDVVRSSGVGELGNYAPVTVIPNQARGSVAWLVDGGSRRPLVR